MPEPAIHSSYTVVKSRERRSTYRGAIRRYRDNGVIWECHDVHMLPKEANACGQAELDRRRQAGGASDAG